MTKWILSLMIATCGGCWTGTTAAQSTIPTANQTATRPATAAVADGATPATAREGTGTSRATARPSAEEPVRARPAAIGGATPATRRTGAGASPATTRARAADEPASGEAARTATSAPAAQVAVAAATEPSPPRTTARLTTSAPAAPVAVAAAEPAAAAPPVSATDATTPAPPAVVRGSYLTAGALYLPIDEGYLAANLGAGKRFLVGARELRVGARLSYGESPYSQVGAGLVGVAQLHWWGSFGIGYGADLGVVSSSQKMGGGWDGTTFGGTLTGTFRHRQQRTELSFDLGIIYAAGEDTPTARFALVSVLLHL